MPNESWTVVDEYLADMLAQQDDALRAALQTSRDAGLPEIAISPNQGKMLQVLARAVSAKAILEIGTLGAYSTIWMARALPAGGKLVTLEAEAKHAEVARKNLARAGVDSVVELREGLALETLPKLVEEKAGPFDLVFIDANKDQIPDYFRLTLQLTRPDSLIIVDNVVRDGAVADPQSEDPDVIGCQQLNDLLANEPRVVATVIQTVGAKGHDGFALVTVL